MDRSKVADGPSGVRRGRAGPWRAAPFPLPQRRFELERIADAHDAVQQGALGKVLVDVA